MTQRAGAVIASPAEPLSVRPEGRFVALLERRRRAIVACMAVDFTDEQIWLHDQQRELGPDGDRQLAELFAEQFPPQALVLDAGGGSGTAVAALIRARHRVLLVDLSAAMLQAGAGRDVPRLRADLCDLPLADGSVGGVHAAFVLQNIPQWTRAVAEIARVLQPAGTALIAWGQPVIDPVFAAVRRHLLDALTQAGAAVGLSACGLDDLDTGHAAFAHWGLTARSEHVVTGVQTRTIGQLVAILAGNPFMHRAGAEQQVPAARETLAWATAQFGDPDLPRRVEVEHHLHSYRRFAPR